MTITLHTGTPDTLPEIIDALAAWQAEGASVQLHPGDIGWEQRFGTEPTAAKLRVWRRDGEPVVAGVLDAEDGLIRLAVSTQVDADEDVAARVVADLTEPGLVLPAGRASVEARCGAALRSLFEAQGWAPDEPWTPLRFSLAQIVPGLAAGLRLEVLDAHAPEALVADRVAVQRAAFTGSTFTVERWHAMAAGAAYRDGRCVLLYDEDGHAVAAATVWSAGAGRPGVIEPLGAHPDFRGRGHGRAVTHACFAALRDLGATSVLVATPATNTGAVAAYLSAGMERLPDVTDFRRPE